MKKNVKTRFARNWQLLLFFFLPFSLAANTVTWDGGGDGIHWDDPQNWNSNVKPTTLDSAIITTSNAVIIRQTEVAESIIIQDNATLTVLSGASLTSNNSARDGIRLLMNATLVNHGTINVLAFENEGINVDETGAKVDNYGNITIDGNGASTPSEGIEIDEGTFFNNYETAVLDIKNTQNEVFCSEGTVVNDGLINLETNSNNNDGLEIDDAPFTNNGVLTILINGLSGSAIDIDNPLINNGLINITGNNSLNESILIRDNGSITNSACAVINNAIDNQIQIDLGGSFTNSGLFADGFSGIHQNNGVFTNDEEIRTANGTFSTAPNVVTGNGQIIVGTFTNQSLCFVTPPVDQAAIVPVPTLSEWGLVILGLIVLNLGVLFLKRLETIIR